MIGVVEPADVARTVETVVVPERGHWAVEIVVVFDDGVVRKRIGTHRSRRRGRTGRRSHQRAAERELSWIERDTP